MSTPERSDSPLVRFFDSFLQEKNIKWVLATGLLILLGSSLMMVTRGWTSFDPTLKFLVIIGYTAAIYFAGHWSYRHLALRKTGTVLMALTVLLIPATFVAWHWLWASSESLGTSWLACVLLAVHTALAAFASQRTFAHFLRGNQTTFVASYLLLSVAGAVAPSLAQAQPDWSWVGAVGLWMVFSIGVVKVNRHVFWLTEEHRQPRIFGFFPIALLGAQFLFVFAANFAHHIPLDWFGLACVLVAVPVLLTADSVTRVFQERTGDIARPIPWPIILPLGVGIVLCAGGIGLAASGMATGVPYALVPTAALAAAMMGVVARRTHRAAFVWAMLAGILVAYNFSPVFFQELARVTIEQGAQAVSESRLPYAFYGLTYLPLMIACLIAAVWARRRGSQLFAQPLQQFVVGLSVLLLIAAFGHIKALVPVAMLMSTMFVSMTILLCDRRLAWLGFAAFLIAAGGAAPFVQTVTETRLAAELYYVGPLGAATLLLLVSHWLDRQIRLVPFPGKVTSGLVTTPTLIFSFVTTILAAAVWTSWTGMPNPDTVLWPGLAIAALLTAHSLVWARRTTSWMCLAFIVVESVRQGFAADLSVWSLAELFAVAGLFMWGVTYVLERQSEWRVSRAWADVGRQSSLIVLSLLTFVIAIPCMLLEMIGLPYLTEHFLAWPFYVVLIIWCFDAARRIRQPITTCIGFLGVFVLASWTLVEFVGGDVFEWLPLAWGLLAVAAVSVVEVSRQVLARMDQRIVTADGYRAVQMITLPVEVMVRGLLFALAASSLIVYHVPLMLASGVAIAGLFGLSIVRHEQRMRMALLVLTNWVVILLGVQACTPARNLFELFLESPTIAACLLAVLAASSTLVWQLANRHLPPWRGVATTQISVLRCATGLGLLATLPSSVVSPGNIALTAIAYVIMATSEFRFACSRQDVRRVWSGLAVLTVAFAYFGWFDVLRFGSGFSMFLPFAVGGCLSAASNLARRNQRTAILAGPFLSVGVAMPLMTVVIATGRHVAHGDEIVWKGLNSLALLGSSGFYFWHAIERHSKWFGVLAGGILNVALMLVFRELSFSDPQFYLVPIGMSILVLVEVMKREIPAVWHNPLRYAGALVILVSPMFHILGDSWLPMLSLMVSATLVLLVAIGLRIRALMYTGTAFLVADLVAMVVRGGIEHPNLLWIAGVGFGAAVLMLGAVLENNREKMLQRLRTISSQLEHWT